MHTFAYIKYRNTHVDGRDEVPLVVVLQIVVRSKHGNLLDDQWKKIHRQICWSRISN
jgi:hypothetical protein